MTTKNTTQRFKTQRILFIPADFLNPNAKANPSKSGPLNAKKSKYVDKKFPVYVIGAICLKLFFIVSLIILSIYRLSPFAIDADPIIYSSNKFHPIINAINSPIAT